MESVHWKDNRQIMDNLAECNLKIVRLTDNYFNDWPESAHRKVCTIPPCVVCPVN